MAQGIGGEGKTEAPNKKASDIAPVTEFKPSHSTPEEAKALAMQKFFDSLTEEQLELALAAKREKAKPTEELLSVSPISPAPAKTVATLSSVPVSSATAPAKTEPLPSVRTESSSLSSSSASTASSSQKGKSEPKGKKQFFFSLIDPVLSVNDETWLLYVMVMPKPYSHAFLLIEGVDNEEKIYWRCEFALFFLVSAEQVPNPVFITIKACSPEDIVNSREVQSYKRMVCTVSKEKAKLLLHEIGEDQKKEREIGYSFSGIGGENCASWISKKLARFDVNLPLQLTFPIPNTLTESNVYGKSALALISATKLVRDINGIECPESLKSIEVNHQFFDKESVTLLCWTLTKARFLTSLTLQNCQFEEEGTMLLIETLTKVLERSSCFKKLSLINGQNIKRNWHLFIKGLANLHLITLDISGNNLDDEQLLTLVETLKINKTITRCVFDRNRLSYRGFQSLLGMLATHPTLTTLSVRENLIWETDKSELDRTVGSVLREEKCHLQTVDVSGNYLMSRATHPTRLAALRQLLRSTGLSAEEFAQAEWIREKDSSKGRHLTILSLQINGSIRDFEVPIEVMETLAAYGREEKLDTDLRKWRDLQSGLTDTLRRYPALRPVRLRDLSAENIKEQKRVCKQLLFFHPHAPLKAYLKSHRKLCSSALPTAPSLLLPGVTLTSQAWKVYFVAKKASALDEHAMLVWEGLYSYGQRMIKAAHLQAVKRGEGMFAPKQIVIDYFPFDIQRGESFRRNYYLVAFTVSKKRIKAMELLIEREIGELPGKYKMILSSGSSGGSFSADEQQRVMTNCQKWALEKLEMCLEMKEGTLQAQMSARPSATAANLQKLPVAERIVGMDEKVESGVVPMEGGSKCCVM